MLPTALLVAGAAEPGLRVRRRRRRLRPGRLEQPSRPRAGPCVPRSSRVRCGPAHPPSPPAPRRGTAPAPRRAVSRAAARSPALERRLPAARQVDHAQGIHRSPVDHERVAAVGAMTTSDLRGLGAAGTPSTAGCSALRGSATGPRSAVGPDPRPASIASRTAARWSYRPALASSTPSRRTSTGPSTATVNTAEPKAPLRPSAAVSASSAPAVKRLPTCLRNDTTSSAA